MLITTLQLIIFLSYVGGLLIYFKKPLPSISDSWYELPKGWNHLFTLFCWSLGILMLFQGTGEYPYFFFSGAGLMFVGAATQFKWKGAYTNLVHYFGAVCGIIFSLIGLGHEYHVWWPLIIWSIITYVFNFLRINNFTWWAEIAAFIIIITGLYSR